jgi:Zn-finger nucleic acid-binding protein
VRAAGPRYAGGVPYRDAPSEPPSGRQCPRCRSELRRQALGPNQVERCSSCHGMWIAAAEFNELLADLDRREAVRTRELPHREVEEEIRYAACPRCAEIMNRQVFARASGIMVDTCKKHGIWLDRGELRRVVDYLAQRAAMDPLHILGAPPARQRTTAPPPRRDEPAEPRRPSFLESLIELLISSLA